MRFFLDLVILGGLSGELERGSLDVWVIGEKAG